MPRDVVLGEGYEGDVMVTPVAPGQHVGQYNVQDGSSSLLQPEEDGGLGHRRHRHHHGGGWGRRGGWGGGWGPAYYEPLYVEDITARRPFILDDDSDEAKAKRLEAKLKLKKLEEEAKAKGVSGLSALGDAAMPCIQRIIAAAAVGAREAIRGVETGVLNSLADVCNHIRRRVCAEVQSHHAAYAKAVSEAVQTAFAEAKPHVEKLLAGGARGVSGMGDLAGPISTQADYNLVSKVQKQAILIQSEISGIGKEMWNWVKDTYFDQEGWTPADNYSYDNMMSFWLANVKSIIVLPSKKPTIEQVREVERLAGGSEKLIALVKRYIPPEDRARGESDRAQSEAMLGKSGLVSPGSAAWTTFQNELSSRASSMFSTGLGVATVAAIGAGLLAAWYFLGRK